MFVLITNWQWDFWYIAYKNKKKNKFRFNHVNQCTKLISHSLSQILNPNDKNEIKSFNLSQIVDQNNTLYISIS